MSGVVSGLATAHEAGVYHRDMKPANILLTGGESPRLKISDFGMAHVTETSSISSVSSMQTQGAIAGTAMYLPPEAQNPFLVQDCADRNAELAAKQDVFAVGVIWYQLCVEALERPPYNFAERLAAHNADSHTIQIISRCLAHPDERIADAMELKAQLGQMVEANWTVPEGCFDVQHLVREYLAEAQN